MIAFHWAYLIFIPITLILLGLFLVNHFVLRAGLETEDQQTHRYGASIILLLLLCLDVSIFGGIFWW